MATNAVIAVNTYKIFNLFSKPILTTGLAKLQKSSLPCTTLSRCLSASFTAWFIPSVDQLTRPLDSEVIIARVDRVKFRAKAGCGAKRMVRAVKSFSYFAN